MLPFVGCESERSRRLVAVDDVLIAIEHPHELGAHLVVAAARRDDLLAAGELGRFAEHQRAARGVELVERVAYRRVRAAAGRRIRFAALASRPTARAARHSTRWRSLAHCTYSRAAFDARMIVSWSPCSSMPKPCTGLPVAAMPSTTFFVHWSSMPITTTAATFGLLPAPISVRKCRSRSAPNCSRP